MVGSPLGLILYFEPMRLTDQSFKIGKIYSSSSLPDIQCDKHQTPVILYLVSCQPGFDHPRLGKCLSHISQTWLNLLPISSICGSSVQVPNDIANPVTILWCSSFLQAYTMAIRYALFIIPQKRFVFVTEGFADKFWTTFHGHSRAPLTYWTLIGSECHSNLMLYLSF